jgi:DNA-binding NtrC family response regulator
MSIHVQSERAERPFITVNCAGLPETLLESELFGHVKGSFTGASADAEGGFVTAHGGVLFLDEVGDMPEEGQVMLLRALESGSVRAVGGREEREVDVQLICATNVDLEAAVAAKRFRLDLYHRINGLCVRLTALRERRGDVPVLLAHCLSAHERRLRRATGGFAPEVMELLQRYDWPGNVRELSRACSRLVLHAREGQLVDMELVERALPQVCAALRAPQVEPVAANLFEQEFESYEDALRSFERAFLAVKLRRFQGNRTALARHLRVSRTTIYRYLLRAGLGSSEDELAIQRGAGDQEGEDDGDA